MTGIKSIIAGLQPLHEDTDQPLIDILRAWMLITDLEFEDAVHLSAKELVDGLLKIHTKLADSLDLLDDEQLREAACRCLSSITVYSSSEESAHDQMCRNLKWDGSKWSFISDPRMRLRATSMTYREALATVRGQLQQKLV